MRSLLLQLDGGASEDGAQLPNLALMRIAAHCRERGDEVAFQIAGNQRAVEQALFLESPDQVYASLLFSRTRPLAEWLERAVPSAVIGGSGWDQIPDSRNGLMSIRSRAAEAKISKLEHHGITTRAKDYSLYPQFKHSIGFTQRGCRMGCGFCDVPVREGKIWADEMVRGIWRGEPWPRNLILWDNDTFGNPGWREVFAAIRDGGFRVSFNQGINARLMDEENAEALASLRCYNASFTTRRWYTAWDNRNDEQILFRGLNWLVKYGVKPDQIMVYMLIGYWPGETPEDREYRRRRLREFGCRPYPMVYAPARNRELSGFARWVIGAYDKPANRNHVRWADWAANGYRPEGVEAVAC